MFEAVRFVFVELDEERSFKKIKVYRWGKLLARLSDAAAHIKKREDQLRRKTRDLRPRIAKCIDFDGGIFENLF